MLVLSRREKEKVLFPTLGISIEVLRVRGTSTRLGVDAPADIPVLRHEIAGKRFTDITPDEANSREQLRDLAHIVRERLDSATTALNLLHKQLDTNENEVSQQIVMDLFHDLQSLEREANHALEGTSEAKAITVLVVEDSLIERKLLGAVLELNGMNVITAKDGQEALEFLSLHEWPDAVLLDMLMPRCDGPTFVNQVRADPQYNGLSIFAVSSLDPGTLGLTIGPGGIDGWFPKPLEPGELVSVLSQRLRNAAGEISANMTFSRDT